MFGQSPGLKYNWGLLTEGPFLFVKVSTVSFSMNFNSSKFISRPAPLRYGVALAFVLLAFLLANGFWLVVDRPINSPLFLAAMVLSSWLFGFRVGIFTAILSGIAVQYFFVVPYQQLIGDRQDMVRVSVFVIEGIILAWLIERLRIASENNKASREELRALTEHQRTLREAEQKRIALEIHDELGQVLTGLKMDIHFLNRRIAEPESELSRDDISKNLNELSNVIDGTIMSVRRIASELRPSILDDFGLLAAIEWQTQEFERKTKIPCYFKTDAIDLDLGAESSTAVFRIFQETLTNIARHAEAKSVYVNFETTEAEVFMTVLDDGVGFKHSGRNGKYSLGVLGMRERARLIGAELDIVGALGGGTSVELKIPIAVS